MKALRFSAVVFASTLAGCGGTPSPSSPSDSSTTFRLSGIVRDVPPGGRPMDATRVEIRSGADLGAAALTDLTGFYMFPALKGGRISIEIHKPGYEVWRIGDLEMTQNRNLDIWLYPKPPSDAAGNAATGRCRDGAWTWSKSRSDACTSNGGVAYEVCPGPLCM